MTTHSQQSLNPEDVVAEDADFPPAGAERGFEDMSGITLNMLGHAHIDIGYRWNTEETIHRIAPWTFRGVLDLMKRVPGFTFAQSQMFLYEAMEHHYPEIFRQIKTMVACGRWEVLGTSWCEYDVMLPCGEAIIRQHLIGLHYALEKLGATRHEVAFFPDSFCGHPATLPQLLAGCGFKYYVFCRGLPQSRNGADKTKRAFCWEGPDNTRLIGYHPFGPYSTPEITEKYLENYLPYIKASVSNQELVLYGKGDHGGGPRDAEIDALKNLKNIPNAPQWRFATAHDFFNHTFTQECIDRLDTHQGNLFAMATGAYTSQARLKRSNRQMEKKLLATEAATVIGTLLSRKPAFPRVDFQKLWQDLLTLQFHDILPGTCAASVVRESATIYHQLSRSCDTFLDDSFNRVRSRLTTTGKQHALVVFNPGLEATEQIVYAECPSWLEFGSPSNLRLLSSDGQNVDFDIKDNHILFKISLPALSMQLLRLNNGCQNPDDGPDILFDGHVVETPFFTIHFDLTTGNINQIVDKRHQRNLLSKPGNRIRVLQEHAVATSWVECFTGEESRLEMITPPRIIEKNRFLTRISSTCQSMYSRFEREMTVYRDIERIDFRLRVDWHEGNSFLKIGFTPQLAAPELTASIAHGTVRIEDPGREFCMHDWIDLNDGQWGMAFLNDGAYGCNVVDDELGISVLRTVRDMDPGMAQGENELCYSLVPYRGDLSPSHLQRTASNFLGGLMARFEGEHPGGIKSWGIIDNSSPLPDTHSFLKIDKHNVAICAFKMPQEDWTPDTLVIRMREMDGRATTCSLTVPVEPAEVLTADHLERTQNQTISFEKRQIMLTFNPHEIKTILVRLTA